MLKVFSWAVLPAGLVSFLFIMVGMALDRPIVKMGMDGKCLSVLMVTDDQEVEVGCDAVDLKHDRYTTQYVFAPSEIRELERIARN